MRDNQRVFITAAQDKDLVSLGRKLVEFVMRTEFSIVRGGFQGERGEMMNVGLPFVMWLDSLPHCAQALRAKGEEDGACVLELKRCLMTAGGHTEAYEIATKALVRNPNHPYFWYAVTKAAMHEECLRAAKRGLKCKNITPFVRFSLLYAAVTTATELGLHTLQDTSTSKEGAEGGQKWELGVAFLNSAYDDAKAYIDEGPPDMRGLKAVLQIYILLSVAIQGPELSIDLRELDVGHILTFVANILIKYCQPAMKKLKNAYAFSAFLGQKSAQSEARLAQETITRLYSAASDTWGPTVAALDRSSSSIHTSAHRPVPASQAESELAKWLQDDEHDTCAHPQMSRGDVAMWRCSWCSNPSAALRKCSGCGITRLVVFSNGAASVT
ncbi:hypothetical protein HWV62_39106 [Athelia sp. TMB]|nr:hypothetical protein HWV62_39106 [Athelia sp. TMB]